MRIWKRVNAWNLLFLLQFRQARNRLQRLRKDWLWSILLGLAGLAFVAIVYLFFARVFSYLMTLPDFTRPFLLGLLQRLWTALLFSVTVLVLVSGALNALAALYLDREGELILTLPIRRGAYLMHRSYRVWIQSTYMIHLLILPILVAMVRHLHLPLWSFFWQMLVVLVFFAALTPWSMLGLTLLVRWLPVRRLQQILYASLALVVALLLLYLRWMRPERMVRPLEGGELLALLQSLTLPGARWWPQGWAATLMLRPFAAAPWLEATRLATFGFLAFLSVSAAMFLPLYRAFARAWYRSRESLTLVKRRRYGAWMISSPSPSRWWLAREWWNFSRDPTQWGQLLLIVAVVAIYFFNIKFIPVPFHSVVYLIWLLNTAMNGFILSALAARFVLPAYAADGAGQWLIYVLPDAPEHLFRTRWWFYWLALTLLAQVMSWGSLVLLHLKEAWFILFNGYLSLAFSLVVTTLALALGVRFRSANRAEAVRVAMSSTGLVFMILSFFWVGLSLGMTLPYVWHHLRQQMFQLPPPIWSSLLVLAHLGLTVVVTRFLYHMGKTRAQNPT